MKRHQPKINFTLDTLFKRNDGYHEIEMIMTTVDLNDRLTFHKRKDRKIVVEIEHNYVPSNHKNLAYRAAQLFIEQYQLKQGVTISIDKNTCFCWLSWRFGRCSSNVKRIESTFNIASLEELALLGSKIGTDIPFCIYNKTALCTGRGEKIEFLNKPPSAWVILAKPNLGISSPDIFKLINLDKRYDVHTKMCYEALENRDYQQLCQSLFNRLEPISVSKHHKSIN